MKMKTYSAPDGLTWGVTVQNPASSNAIIYFRHPGGESSRLDRYNWVITDGPEARSVTGRLTPEKVLDDLTDAQIARLFQRSMAVSRPSGLVSGPSLVRG